MIAFMVGAFDTTKKKKKNIFKIYFYSAINDHHGIIDFPSFGFVL